MLPEVRTQRECDVDATTAAREREMLRVGVTVAARSLAIWAGVCTLLLIAGLYLMRDSLTAASATMKSGEFWYESFMPSVLLGLLGMVFGLLCGWRMTASSGLVGVAAWLLGAVGVLLMIVIGGAAGAQMYEAGVPHTFWIGLGVMTLTAMMGMTYFTIWAA